MNVRTALLARAAAVLLVTSLAACTAGSEKTASAPAPGSAAPFAGASTAATPSSAPFPSPSPVPAVRVLELAYIGGTVTGDTGRQSVAIGEQVVLRLTSDVAEQIHVHGYDLEAAVPAGGTVELPLTATIPGGFEVELHESGKALLQLRVA